MQLQSCLGNQHVAHEQQGSHGHSCPACGQFLGAARSSRESEPIVGWEGRGHCWRQGQEREQAAWRGDEARVSWVKVPGVGALRVLKGIAGMGCVGTRFRAVSLELGRCSSVHYLNKVYPLVAVHVSGNAAPITIKQCTVRRCDAAVAAQLGIGRTE